MARSRNEDGTLTTVLELATIGFGTWTLYCHGVVFAAGGFHTLVRLAWIPVLLASLLVILRVPLRARPTDPPPPTPGTGRTSPWVRLLCAGIVVLGYALSENYLVLWGGGVFILAWFLLDGSPHVAGRGQPQPETASAANNAALMILVVVAVGVTLVTHRADLDDSFYLSMAIGALDSPETPLLSSDSMFGVEGLPLQNPIYKTNTYELLLASCSRLTGADLKWLYYLAFPALSAALLVPTTWLAARELGSSRPTLAAALVLLVMVTWGDVHWSHANFGLVRLFQGKAVLVSVAVPAIIYFSARFVHRGDAASWAYLLLAQIGALGLSANGVFTAPLASGLVLLGSVRPSSLHVRRFAVGILASAYVLAFGIVLSLELSAVAAAQPEPLRQVGTAANLHAVLGSGMRADLILAGLLSLAAIPSAPERWRTTTGWALAIVLLLLSPITSDAVAFVQALNWRILWAAPFPLILGLALAGVSSLGPSWRSVRLGSVVAAVIATLFAWPSAPWTTSRDNEAVIASPRAKVDPFHNFAAFLVGATPPGGVVLAPWDVSAWLPTFHHHPPAIEIREFHLRLIERARGPEEASLRRHLQRLVELDPEEEMSIPPRPGGRFKSFRRDLDAFGVTTVLVDQELPWKRQLTTRLRAAGFQGRSLGIYQLWVRPVPQRGEEQNDVEHS